MIFSHQAFAVVADHDLEKTAKIYNRNRDVNALYKKAVVGLSDGEKNNLQNILKEENLWVGILPELKFSSSQLTAVHNGKKVIFSDFDLVNLSFQANGTKLVFDLKSSYYQNILKWTSQLKNQKEVGLLNLFVPRAEAVLPFTALGIAIVGLSVLETVNQIVWKESITAAMEEIRANSRKCFFSSSTEQHPLTTNIIDFFKTAKKYSWCDEYSFMNTATVLQMYGESRGKYCDEIKKLENCLRTTAVDSQVRKEIVENLKKIPFRFAETTLSSKANIPKPEKHSLGGR